MHVNHSTALDALLAAERLPVTFAATVDTVCRPLAQRVKMLARAAGRCITLGICGAQGSGKSTIARVLQILLETENFVVATLSIDDFYLAHAERMRLAATVHPLLRTRGVPGTHDIPLALGTLASLRSGRATALPAFDKGRDDRCPESLWPVIDQPAQIVVLEGWCVGAVPQATEQLQTPINELEQCQDAEGIWRRYINDALATDYQRLFASIDRLVLLAAPGFDVVARWRCEQEHKLRERVMQQHGDLTRVMSDAQVREFVAHYERLTRHVLAEMPARADAVVRLDEARRVLDVDFESLIA